MLRLTLILLGASIAVALPKSKTCGQPWRSQIRLKVPWELPTDVDGDGFPWLVGIFYDEGFRCSGALIQSHVVLTAAHCISRTDAKQLQVSTGAWDLRNAEEKSRQNRKVSKYVVHEEFNPNTGANDYALVFLSEPVKITKHVDFVCLPEADDDFTGSKCFGYGWDMTMLKSIKSGDPIPPEKNKRLVLSHEGCQNSLRTLRRDKGYDLHKSFICTKGETRTINNWLNGGIPLSCQLRNSHPVRYVLAGIVSWGPRGENAPMILANIAGARTWIDKHLADNKL